ncbi:MAG: chloride channel protein [Bacteroidales bacterium]|nr:chloride channel protein [Bacteroidales bacterium]
MSKECAGKRSVMEMLRSIPEKNRLLLLSLVVGLFSGGAAVLLHTLINLIRGALHSAFTGKADILLYLVLPGVGMLISLVIVRYLIKDRIGHGVTKVLVAVSKNDSRIRPHNMWSSVLTSSITIGFGGSVGAEAPIVYTGAAIGSNFARYLKMSYRSATILIGCGAAGAIAGIFKAPLAGVLFTLEILLFNISMTSMMPLLLSTVSAAMVSYIFTGDSLPFECTLSPFNIANVPFYIFLGVFCGFVSLYFLRTTLRMEDVLQRFRKPFTKWLVCSILLGVLILLFPPLFGEGYDFLHPLLNGEEISYDVSILPILPHSPWVVPVFFLAVMLLKVFSMTFTNAGGGVGGTFGPTLFVGAIAGFVVARTLNLLLASSPITVPEQNFVLVGMAGLMAGVMQAPMTAIFLIAEMTGGYELFLPLILTSTISFGTIRIFEKYSIYTKRIAASGELLTHDSDQAVLTLLRVSDLIERDFSTISIDATLGEFVKVIGASERNLFPVIDSKKHFQGYVSLGDVRADMFNVDLYETRHVFNYMSSAPAYVYEDENMESVMKKFEKTDAWNLPVVKSESDRTYLGFVSKSKIFSSYREELKELSQD